MPSSIASCIGIRTMRSKSFVVDGLDAVAEHFRQLVTLQVRDPAVSMLTTKTFDDAAIVA
jgi:hypothetical protein